MTQITKRAKWIIVNQYENAESDMFELRKAMLKELCKELNLDMDRLIIEVNHPQPTESPSNTSRIQIVYINPIITNDGKEVNRIRDNRYDYTYSFRMYDSDDIHYFSGYATTEEEIIDLFDEYQAGYGVTRLDISDNDNCSFTKMKRILG